MEELFWQKIRRILHGTLLFPHILRKFEGGVFCTCGYKKITN
jgi:hypothetical protein